jgi:hypothetical protein
MSIKFHRLSLLTHFSSDIGCAVMGKNGNFTAQKNSLPALIAAFARFT